MGVQFWQWLVLGGGVLQVLGGLIALLSARSALRSLAQYDERPKVCYGLANSGLWGFTGAATGSGGGPPSLEERLARLEQQLAALERSMPDRLREVEDRSRKTAADITEVKVLPVRGHVAALEEVVRALAAQRWIIVGLAMIALGVGLATWGSIIAQ